MYFSNITLGALVIFTCSMFPILEVNAQIFTHDITNEHNISIANNFKNFTIYKNLEMGFQIQYPVHWEPVEKKSPSIETIEFVSSDVQGHDMANNIFFTISRENISKDLPVTIDSITERNVKLAKSLTNFTSINSSEITIDGLPAQKILYNFTSPALGPKMVFQTLNIWAINDANVYTISYTAPGSVFLDFIKTIEMMIDTFEIIQ